MHGQEQVTAKYASLEGAKNLPGAMVLFSANSFFAARGATRWDVGRATARTGWPKVRACGRCTLAVALIVLQTAIAIAITMQVCCSD
jgi:hypothetical protein